MTIRDDPGLTALRSRLAELAGAVEFPATPPVRDAVLASVRARAASPPARLGVRRRLVIALAAAVAAIGASLAVPQWRDVVAGWFGIRGVTVEQRPGPLPTLPSSPQATVTPTPGAPGSGLDLGNPVALADASRSLDFVPLVPQAPAPPDAAWVRRPPDGGALSLVYAPGPGRPAAVPGTGVSILVTELHATVDTRFIEKIAGSSSTVAEVSIQGEPGLWIAGAPHEVMFTNPDGSGGVDNLRLATNTLLWQHGSVLIRIEGAQSLDQAQAMAASMR